MKKTTLFTALLLAIAVLVSCATADYDYRVFDDDDEGWAPVVEYWNRSSNPVQEVVDTGDGIHVKDFKSLKEAFNKAKKGSKIVIIDSDIIWPSDASEQQYDVTGLTIDLNGHTISNIGKNELNFVGDSFTIKNGIFTASEDNNRYSLCINYSGDNATTPELQAKAESMIPKTYSDSDPVWAKRVVLENVTATACLIGYSTAEVKNSNFAGGQYRALVMQGSSGIVENVKAITGNGGGSAGLVAHSYGVVLLKGDVTIKGKFGIYAARNGKISVDAGAKVMTSGYQTYGVYIETDGVATLGSGVTIGATNGFNVYMKTGTLNLEKGVVLLDDKGQTTTTLAVDGDGTINDKR